MLDDDGKGAHSAALGHQMLTIIWSDDFVTLILQGDPLISRHVCFRNISTVLGSKDC
jgi:hypothetical protein